MSLRVARRQQSRATVPRPALRPPGRSQPGTPAARRSPRIPDTPAGTACHARRRIPPAPGPSPTPRNPGLAAGLPARRRPTRAFLQGRRRTSCADRGDPQPAEPAHRGDHVGRGRALGQPPNPPMPALVLSALPSRSPRPGAMCRGNSRRVCPPIAWGCRLSHAPRSPPRLGVTISRRFVPHRRGKSRRPRVHRPPVPGKDQPIPSEQESRVARHRPPTGVRGHPARTVAYRPAPGRIVSASCTCGTRGTSAGFFSVSSGWCPPASFFAWDRPSLPWGKRAATHRPPSIWSRRPCGTWCHR